MMNYLDNEIKIIEQKKLEKVIKGLEEAVDWRSTEISLTVVDRWVARNALALLKAREPMKPELITETLPYHYICSACGLYLPFVGAKYCSYCGKAVKWE